MQPPLVLLNAVRALGGFFYPTENLKYTDLLGYYRQREWRIVANLINKDGEVSLPLTKNQMSELFDVDADFFGRRMKFPTGEYTRAEQCRILSHVDGRFVLDYVRRIIVPEESIDEARRLLSQITDRPDIVPLDAIEEAR